MKQPYARAWLAAICSVGAVPSAMAAFGTDYDAAVVKIERGHYADALPLLDAVIEDVPASQKRVRLYGVRFAPYTPYFYRGLAHYRLGRCEDALRDFLREARFDVLAGRNSEALAQAEADCRARLPAAQVPRPAADETPPPPADALGALVAAYFKGEYSLVATYDPAVLAAPAEQAQAWLYRAAAQYTLAVLAGDDAATVIEGVQASLAHARSDGKLPAVDLSQFPPKFVKLATTSH